MCINCGKLLRFARDIDMNELIAFLMATVISFWGSLQLGPVNICVIQTALAHGKRQALIVALGGVLPEIIYSSIAVLGANLILQYPLLMQILGWFIVGLLFVLGIYYIFKPFHEKFVRPSKGAGFTKGFMLAMLNPQLLAFWLGILVYMEGFVDFQNGSFISPYITFVFGTAFGAWCLLYLFTRLSVAYEVKLKALLKNNINRIVGCLFILLAMFELGRRVLFE